MALAIKAATDQNEELVRELANFVRSKIALCYEKAADFLSVVDNNVNEVGPTLMSEPQQLWRMISSLHLRPLLNGSTIRSLASPSFGQYGNAYLFQHQIYHELERYHLVMQEIFRMASDDQLGIKFDNQEYRRWLDADLAMRGAFIDIGTKSKFSELCRIVGPTWDEKERNLWKEMVKKRATKAPE